MKCILIIIFSTHPLWTFLKPDVFREKFQDGTLDTFDIIFSYSSLEHSGLGRYDHETAERKVIKSFEFVSQSQMLTVPSCAMLCLYFVALNLSALSIS